MIVYRDQRFRAESRSLLDQLRSQVDRLDFYAPAAHDCVVDAFISAGTLESSLADTIFPEADGVHPLTCMLRRVSVGLGHVLWHSWRSIPEDAKRWRSTVLERLNDVEQQQLPSLVQVTVPEGFAYYAVYPEAYLESAQRCHTELGPFSAVCIGLRSIGATLSGAVAAALEELGCEVRSFTVRPRGHPFSRRPSITASLQNSLVEDPGARFILVDEGPGISGSSLAGLAELLGGLGIPDDRILLLPSWRTDGSQLRSAAARERWPRHRQFTVSFEELWIDSGRLDRALPGWHWRDFSGGLWREELYADPEDYPAVQPQHERRKYLLQSGPGRSLPAKLLSFAGLGGRSTRTCQRAKRLAEPGFTPAPEETMHGFLMRRFIPGWPLSRGGADGELLETLAQYLAHLVREHPAEPSVSAASLREMVEVNVAEGLGDEWRERLRVWLPTHLESRVEHPVALDGRMQAHEWIRTDSGYLKADAFDHYDDHFFPGCQDIAWDMAGAAYELELNPESRSHLIQRYRQLSGDHTIGWRLPLYSLYFLAYRLGYVSLAASVLGKSPDGVRFTTEMERYARLLQGELSDRPGRCWDG
jgi:hypothetical protein